VFIYVREAHPGERVTHHDMFQTKLANARLLRDEVGIRRPILVDDLDGSAHRAYGLLPNMTWIVSGGGRVIYKSEWTSAANIEAFIDRYSHGRRRKPATGTIAPYVTEQLEFRDVDRDTFYQRLRRNGERAYEEFKRAEQIWQRRG
jgi:hypothetical protein